MVRNVILLTIDALRPDHLSCYGYTRETSPHLDKFAADSLRFKQAYSTSSHTREAMPSILTGHYSPNAISEDYSLARETIPGYLADTHVSGAFHSNPYLSRGYGFEQEFNKFDDDMYLGQNRYLALIQRAIDKYVLNRGEYHARAENINRRSLEWIDSLGDRPFFLWNHYMDVHGPYNPPDGSPYSSVNLSNVEAQRLYHQINENEGDIPQEKRDLAVDLYDGEINYLDAQLGDLFQALEQRGILEESLIIVTADHGDLFGEHGRYGHPRYVYPELTRIPMIIQAPEIEGGNVPGPASTIDILPTILDWLENKKPGLAGDSLISSTVSQRGAIFSSATAEGDDESLRRFAAWDRERGYLLTREILTGAIREETPIHPLDGEQADLDSLSPEETESYERLRDAILDHSEKCLDHDLNEVSEDRSTEVDERLESLGYT